MSLPSEVPASSTPEPVTDVDTGERPDERAPVDPARRRRALIVLGLVAVSVVVADQLTKFWIVTSIKPRMESGEGPIVLLGGFLKITYTENTGASFSIGAGYTWIFTIIAVIVAIVILRSARRLGSIGWMSNFSFYYAHHMSTIEGGMVCTDDAQVYQQIRMLRSHGMVRESNDADYRTEWREANPELNPDFIFAYPAYNVRNTEIGAIMGRSQLKRLDANVLRRTQNLQRFLERIDDRRYQTDFKLEGSSNYAFNLIMKAAAPEYVQRLMATMRETGIEFRRGSAGGGNQLRQPYLRGVVPVDHHLAFPNTEHVHFYGFYIGNFPDLRDDEIDAICRIVNAV